jgi:hydrogenase maturation protease
MLRPLFEYDCLVLGCGNPLIGDDGFGPAVIQQLHAQVRSLSRPQLEALVTAFRQRFRLAEGASVAAAITQKQHHDWVEAYLVQVEDTLQKL